MVVESAERGRRVEAAISIRTDTRQISINQDGMVSVLKAGQTQLNQIGQIQLARFTDPQGLLQMGQNLFAQTVGSGNPLVSTPGQDGLGTLRQNFLEASNVEPVRELVDLITTQRTFELNSQGIQVADQALQLVNNLRRF